MSRTKVRIMIEFEVTGLEDEPPTESQCKGAASMAAWDHLCLTTAGVGVTTSVKVHVDGFGHCEVRVGEDHE